MGFFNKKKSEEKTPTLPPLPKLPEFPRISEIGSSRLPFQLPSFPDSPIGQKFSQNTIKDAVAGEKESEGVQGDEFSRGIQMRPELPRMPLTLEEDEEIPPLPRKIIRTQSRTKKSEPLFIRIDKFEESLEIFEKIKQQVEEIENILTNIKQTKSQEEFELENWEKEMRNIKSQIEKVDNNLFSNIE